MEDKSFTAWINGDRSWWGTGKRGRENTSAIQYKALSLSNPNYCSEQWNSKINKEMLTWFTTPKG